jgi:hypothetical protein
MNEAIQFNIFMESNTNCIHIEAMQYNTPHNNESQYLFFVVLRTFM